MSRAAERRQTILDAIARSAQVAKRDAADVTLIAVSKGRPMEQIEELIDAGQRDRGPGDGADGVREVLRASAILAKAGCRKR